MNILDEILANKRKEVAERKKAVPVNELERGLYYSRSTVSLRKALLESKSGIIAEIKRKSPSKGVINPDISIVKTSTGYVKAGASALSILTDTQFFGGVNDDILIARKLNDCPILRKDFIVDEYQIFEARSIGADAILLIAAALEPGKLRDLSQLAHSLKLEVLMEVHNEKELRENLGVPVDLIGVNNRDLKTFNVSIENSKRLSDLIPSSVVKISESGIDSVEAIVELRSYGFRGFLMGQTFMQYPRPEEKAKMFIDSLNLLGNG